MDEHMLSTPFFLIRKEELDTLTGKIIEALEEYWPNSIAAYSFKTNNLPWIICYMKSRGFFAEVVSDDEYALAKKIGFNPKCIVFNGPVKSKAFFSCAVRDGAIVNIDSHRELAWVCELQKQFSEPIAIGLRVNFDIERLLPGESTSGSEGSRFGFCYENGELSCAIAKLNQCGVCVAGLHLHISSKTRSRNIYTAISRMACKLASEYDLTLKYIDIGGGFFGGLPERPQFADYLKDVTDVLAEYFDQSTSIILEPGMSVIGAAIEYISSVIDVKDTLYNRFVVTDGSRIHIDPLMTKSEYYHKIIPRLNSEKVRRTAMKTQSIVGFTCMENDRLMCIVDADELYEGDRIVYQKVGAYTMCLSPQFISFYPAIYLDDYGDVTEVRKKGDESDYISFGSGKTENL